MKKYIFLSLTAFLLFGCKPKTENNQTSTIGKDTLLSDHVGNSAICFDTLAHDFGKVIKDAKPECYFKYHNTGTEPLVLINVSAGCGCTVIDFPKTSLMPNAVDSIHVRFTGAKEGGDFIKTITVQSNASNGTQHLQIKGHQM